MGGRGEEGGTDHFRGGVACGCREDRGGDAGRAKAMVCGFCGSNDRRKGRSWFRGWRWRRVRRVRRLDVDHYLDSAGRVKWEANEGQKIGMSPTRRREEIPYARCAVFQDACSIGSRTLGRSDATLVPKRKVPFFLYVFVQAGQHAK